MPNSIGFICRSLNARKLWRRNARLPKGDKGTSFAAPPVIAGRPRDVPGGGLGPAPSWSERRERGGEGAP